MVKAILPLLTGMLALTMSSVSVPQTRSAQVEVSTPSPRREVLREPIYLEVKLEAEIGTDREMNLLCPTSTYQGEFNSKNGDSTLQMAISGTIQEVNRNRFLISYDLEVRLRDSTGLVRFSAAASGLLSNGKPARIVTIAGRSVTLIASTIKPRAGPTR